MFRAPITISVFRNLSARAIDLATRLSFQFNFLPKFQPEINLVEMVSVLGSSLLDKETFEDTKSSLKDMMPLDACPTEIARQFINGPLQLMNAYTDTLSWKRLTRTGLAHHRRPPK